MKAAGKQWAEPTEGLVSRTGRSSERRMFEEVGQHLRVSVVIKKLRGPGTFTEPGLLETDVLLSHRGAGGGGLKLGPYRLRDRQMFSDTELRVYFLSDSFYCSHLYINRLRSCCDLSSSLNHVRIRWLLSFQICPPFCPQAAEFRPQQTSFTPETSTGPLCLMGPDESCLCHRHGDLMMTSSR